MQAIKRNLRDEVFVKHPDKRFMYCQFCGAEYSAHNGDYWNVPDDHEFRCCDVTMLIATKETMIALVED